jgi:D-psicose/D-tagatose/L-ribulose 3-epimerase
MSFTPKKNRLGMHTSLWTGSWTREAAEIAIPEAAEHGIDLLEIAVLSPDQIDAKHTRKLLEKHGVEASGSLCLPATARGEENPEAAIAFLMPALEKAHEIGCNILGGVTYSELGHKSGKRPTDKEYANLVKTLKPVAKQARKYDMRLGIEPCNRYETHLINTADQALKLLEMIDEPNVVIHLDTYHMNIEEKGAAGGIIKAGKACSYIHLSESDRGVPGTGTIDWDATFRAMVLSGFKGDMVMESFVTLPPEIETALCVWRTVAKDRHEVLEKGFSFIKAMAKVHGLI